MERALRGVERKSSACCADRTVDQIATPGEKGRKNDAKFFSVGHEYLLVYAKSQQHLRDLNTQWREEKPGAREIWDEYLRFRELHGADDGAIEKDLIAWFAALPKTHPSKKWARYKRVDKNGPWRDDNISWPGGGGPRYDVIHPVTALPCKVPERGWIWPDPETMKEKIRLGIVVFREDHTEPPLRKSHLRPIAGETDAAEPEANDRDVDLAVQVRGSVFYKQAQVSVKHLRSLMGASVFTNPKDYVELARLFEYVLNGSDGIVMDFFAGSGTTAEAVFEVCERTGLNCPVVLVQLPEDLDENVKTASGAAKTTLKNAINYLDVRGKPHSLAELTKIRIRLAGERVRSERKENMWSGDTGFRTLRIDTTNMADVVRVPDETPQFDLAAFGSSIKPDRTGEDLLFQVLLDWGLEVTLAITSEQIDGREVFVVDDGGLIACFAASVSPVVVRQIAGRHPAGAVFRDDAFATDAERINAEQIFKELSPDTTVKAI